MLWPQKKNTKNVQTTVNSTILISLWVLEPDRTNAFFKVFVFVSTKTKQNILLAFSVCFPPSTLICFHFSETAYVLIRFRLSSTLNAQNPLFSMPPFLRNHTWNGVFSWIYIFKRLHFWARFSVDAGWKRVKKYAFSYENTLILWGLGLWTWSLE